MTLHQHAPALPVSSWLSWIIIRNNSRPYELAVKTDDGVGRKLMNSLGELTLHYGRSITCKEKIIIAHYQY